MKFEELINRSNFLKDKFKNLEDNFKETVIKGISNNSKKIKCVSILIYSLLCANII